MPNTSSAISHLQRSSRFDSVTSDGLQARFERKVGKSSAWLRFFSTSPVSHGVTRVDMEAARQRIADRGPNLLVNGPVAIAMILLATFMLRRIGSRFSIAEEPLAVVTATALCAVLMGGATIGVGRLGEALVETVRLGNGHLSYRGLRLPWAQHSFEYAIVAAVAFLLVSIVYFGRVGQGASRSHAV